MKHRNRLYHKTDHTRKFYRDAAGAILEKKRRPRAKHTRLIKPNRKNREDIY